MAATAHTLTIRQWQKSNTIQFLSIDKIFFILFFSGFFCCCSPSLSSDCKFDDFKSSVRRDFLKWQENNVRFLFCSTYFLKVVLDWTVFSETLCYGVGQINVHPKCKTEALNTRSFSRRILVDFFLFIYFFSWSIFKFTIKEIHSHDFSHNNN